MVYSALKKLIFSLMFLLSFSMISAASNVIDVQVTESVYEVVNYDPLVAGSGLYFDANENQSVFTLSGNLIVINNHMCGSRHCGAIHCK